MDNINVRNVLRVALYVRVSTAEQAKEGYSIGEQTERLQKYAEAMGWEVINVYTDAGFSGAGINRPGLVEMIKDIKAGCIDKVVVYKLDRLSRSQKDTLFLIEDVFLKNNTDFVSMNENFDTATPFGRAMIGILAVFAQLEREQIKERMSMGREARAKKGYYCGSNHSLIGYEYIEGVLIPNEYEKTLVSEIFDRVLEGEPIKTIGDKLNARGLYHHNGEWQDTTISRMLRNRHYIGEVSFGRQWYPGLHDPIVDKEKFDKVQRLLESRRNYDYSNKHTSFLGGIIYCAHCGARYSRNLWKPKLDTTRTAKYCCYSRSKKMAKMIKDPNCQNKNWEVSELDAIVLGEIRKLATDPNYYNEIKFGDSLDQEFSTKVSLIEEEIKSLSDQISNFMDLYSIKKLTIQEVDEKITPLADRRTRLEAELDELLSDDNNGHFTEEETIEIINTFGDILKRGEIQEIRFAISALIDKIELDNEDVKIYWKFC